MREHNVSNRFMGTERYLARFLYQEKGTRRHTDRENKDKHPHGGSPERNTDKKVQIPMMPEPDDAHPDMETWQAGKIISGGSKHMSRHLPSHMCMEIAPLDSKAVDGYLS